MTFRRHALRNTVGGMSMLFDNSMRSLSRRHGSTCLTENDALADGQKGVERHQNIVFVLLVSAVHVKLSDTFHAQLLFLQLDLVCIGREVGCE